MYSALKRKSNNLIWLCSTIIFSLLVVHFSASSKMPPAQQTNRNLTIFKYMHVIFMLAVDQIQ